MYLTAYRDDDTGEVICIALEDDDPTIPAWREAWRIAKERHAADQQQGES